MTNEQLQKAKETYEAYQTALARERFSGFVNKTYPAYEFGWFNQLLCNELQQFYEDLQAGLMPRLMIFAPPRSGKSELASRRFPAWAMGMDNTLSTIACSNASSLAMRMSRDAKRIIKDPVYHEIFPKTNLGSSRQVDVKYKDDAVDTNELWEIIDNLGKLTGGGYKSAGVSGGITGMGCELGIIDDSTKDYQHASSKVIQQRQIEWYETTFSTRLNPKKNGVLVIMTRWHKNDLAGQLLQKMQDGGEQWRVISFPMVATEDEKFKQGAKTYKTRKKGEILFPERMPQAFVDKCRKRGALTWNALYQQNPTIAGGGIIKSEWFGQYHSLPARFDRVIITADTAMKTKEANDYSVFQLWGKLDNKIYLLDMVRGKWEAPDLLDQAKKFWGKSYAGFYGHGITLNSFNIEDKSSGTGLIQQLIGLGVPTNSIGRVIDKYQRVNDITTFIKNGMVIIPEVAPYRHDFIMECEEFTANDTHTHDDQIDPMVDAINILIGVGGNSYAGWA